MLLKPAKPKKSVAFADAPVVLPANPEEHGEAAAVAFSPLSLSSSSSGSDDEWSGYDKVRELEDQ